MANVKILHCADIHIGAAEGFLGEKATARRFETLITFEKIVDTAIECGVEVVALAGDIFDSNNVESSFFDAVLGKIATAPHIRFIFAAGNHDPLDLRSPFLKKRLPKNLFVLKTRDDVIKFEDLSLCVYGRSFESAFLKGEEAFSIEPHSDYVNLMVVHGDMGSDRGSEYNAITPDFIKNSGMDYIALGHIHKRSEITRLGETCFAYCGCPEGQGFDETDAKGVYIGEIGKGICNLEFVPMSKRMHICEKIYISSVSDVNGIADYVISVLKEKYGDNFGEHLYKIILTGQVPFEEISLAEIKSRISDKVYFIKLKDNTELSVDFKELAGEASLKGIFVKNMLKAIDEADEAEKNQYENALKIGLRAFSGEVNYNED